MPLKGQSSLTERAKKLQRGAALALFFALCAKSHARGQQPDRSPAPAEQSAETSRSNAPPKSSTGGTKQRAERVPLIILVINKETKDVFVYPGLAVTEFNTAFPLGPSDQSFLSTLRYLPIDKLSKSLHSSDEINSLQKPLDERAAIYAQTILRNINGLNVGTSSAWSSAALKTVQRLPALDPDAQKQSGRLNWPPSYPLLMTELSREDGYLLVVEVRNDSQAGVVEKLDFMAFSQGSLSRTYWSRDMHDPTLSLRTEQAFMQVAQRFVDRVKRATAQSGETPNGQDTLRVEVSRLISEAEVLALQKLAQELGGQGQAPLVPESVDRDFITYKSSVPVGKAGELLGALQRELKTVGANPSTGQSGTVRITRQAD